MRRDCRYSISITHTLQCTSACRNNCLKKASWIACRITRLWNCHRNQSRYSSNMAICAPLYGTLLYVYNDYKCSGGPYLCVMERFLPALSCRVQMRHQSSILEMRACFALLPIRVVKSGAVTRETHFVYDCSEGKKIFHRSCLQYFTFSLLLRICLN